jgi:hypothetical protein
MVSMGWPVLTAMYERAMSSISPGWRAWVRGPQVLPAVVPSHCAERWVARPHRERVKTVRVTRQLCAFDRFAGVCIGNDVGLQSRLQNCNNRFSGKLESTSMATMFCVLVATGVVVIGPVSSWALHK